MIFRRIVISALALAIAPTGESCSCLPSTPPLKALAKADAVFSGEVTKIEKQDKPFLSQAVHVKVIKTWKGKVGDELIVQTGSGGGDCGYPFEAGEKYLIYAYHPEAGQWATNICTRTQLLEDATDEILELEGRPPTTNEPSQDPVLELKGVINDGGYDGYVLTLHNRLHERIFYRGFGNDDYSMQVMSDGKWIEYPPPAFGTGHEPILSPAAAERMVKKLEKEHRQTNPQFTSWPFVSRVTSMPIFVTPPGTKARWRVGFQYLTEREFNTGARIQNSKHFVWSDPIDADTQAKSLTFNEAFARKKGE